MSLDDVAFAPSAIESRCGQGQLFPETTVGCQVLLHPRAELQIDADAVWMVGPLLDVPRLEGMVSFGALLAQAGSAVLRWVAVRIADRLEEAGFGVHVLKPRRSFSDWLGDFEATGLFDSTFGVRFGEPSAAFRHHQAARRFLERDVTMSLTRFVEALRRWPALHGRGSQLLRLIESARRGCRTAEPLRRHLGRMLRCASSKSQSFPMVCASPRPAPERAVIPLGPSRGRSGRWRQAADQRP